MAKNGTMKKKNNKKNNYNKISLNFGAIIACYSIILIFLLSLFFASDLEILLKLKPDFTEIAVNSLEVHFVDVGQGDAILVRLPNNETVIVDSGPSSAKDDLLNYIDNIFFRNSKNKTFNYAVLTHSDADHSGNMLAVLEKYKVEKFFRPMIYAEGIEQEIINENTLVTSSNTITYKNLISKLIMLEQNNKIDVVYSFAGITIGDEENTYITFLSPNKEIYGTSNNSENRTNKYSPMLLLEYNTKSFLLTGDAVEENELEVINNTDLYAINLDVDVLKVAHHGSAYSTYQFFLDVVKPEYAVISYGQNGYGLPSNSTVDRLISNLQNNGGGSEELYSTLENGNIIFHIGVSQELQILLINRISDYLFIEWFVVVIIVSVIFVGMSAIKGISFRKTRATNV